MPRIKTIERCLNKIAEDEGEILENLIGSIRGPDMRLRAGQLDA